MPRPATYELIERVVGLQLRGVPLAELADGVLPRLLEVFGTEIGGLFLFHNDDRSLSLAASRGLSPSGRERLERLHAKSGDGWDIPLHGLLNRKAYIIERPHEHPFVPELVPPEIGPRVPNLACVPLYRGQIPVGVLLVIAYGRALNETEVLSQSLVYDVLSLALDAGLRARGETPVPLDPETALPALSCEPWTDPQERVHQLEGELAQATQARDDVQVRLERLEAEHAEATRVLEAEHAEVRRVLEDYRSTSAETLEGERAAAVEHVAERERTHRAQLAKQGAAAQKELSNERTALERALEEERQTAEATIKELQSALVDREGTYETTVRKLQGAIAERDGMLAERDRELAGLTEERDRVQHTVQEAGDTIARLNDEIGQFRADRDDASESQQLELEKTRVLYEQKLAEAETGHRQALAELQGASEAALARAAAAEQRGATLEGQVASAREEAADRREQYEQVVGALEDPTIAPVAAIGSLRERIAALENDIAGLTGERASIERRMAHEVQVGEQQVTAHHRELQQLQTAHEQAVAELQATHQHDAEEGRAVHRREVEQIAEGHRTQVEELQRDFQQRLADERATHDRQLAELSADIERRQALLTQEQDEGLERVRAAESRAIELDGGLRKLRDEVERLHDERAKVVAAVDDPDAEPATVLNALREQVVGLEGELEAATAERDALAARAQDEVENGAERLAAVQAQTGAAILELKTALAAREATLSERERAMETLDEAAARARQATAEAQEVVQRQTVEIERVHGELSSAQGVHAETLSRVAAATGRAEALEGELMAVRTEVGRLRDEREQVLAAVDDTETEPATVIRALRQRVSDFESTNSKLELERAALERRMEAEVQKYQQELSSTQGEVAEHQRQVQREFEEARTTIVRLETEAAERVALDERLVVAERERAEAECDRRAHMARVSELERDLTRSEALLENAREQLDTANVTAREAAEAAAAEEPGSRSRTPSYTPTRVEVLAPPPAASMAPRTHRVLESNPALREQIAFALASELPKPPNGGTLVANLIGAVPDGLAELDEAARAGTLVLAYAADGSGRSRVLGPLRCFTEPPLPAEVVTALERSPGPRRVITLSDDVDALIPTKAALTDAGHSVSMACDPKQALDILAMFTPDVVLADLRTSPEAAADFLDALPIESGLVHLMLVHGDPSGAVLKRVLGRLLRSATLAPGDIVAACRQAIKGPSAPAKKAPAARRRRTTPDPPKPARKLGRRLVGRG